MVKTQVLAYGEGLLARDVLDPRPEALCGGVAGLGFEIFGWAYTTLSE